MAVGRPKEFDEREVLQEAMELFWLRGYEALGVSELLRHLGISRQSLYDTFGNKRQLFIRCIEHYRDTQLSEALALLERDAPPVENVKALLQYFRELAIDRRCRGCLVANTLVELGPHDEEIAALLNDTLAALQKAIQGALEDAQEDGELSPSKSPRALSRALLNALVGLAVTGKLPLGRATVDDIHSGTLSLLD